MTAINPTSCHGPGLIALTCALCAASAPAMAGDWELGLGAAFEGYVGYVSYDSDTASDFEGADGGGTGQIFIVPSVTTEYGLTFGGLVEIEAHLGERNAGVVVDEASLFLQSGWGEVWLGRSDTPGNHMHLGAPEGYGGDVNFAGLSTAALPSLLQFSEVHSTSAVGDDLLRGTLGSTFVTNAGEDTALRFSYFTPRFGGFQLGASFAPDGPNSAPNRKDFFDIGANYTASFGGIDAGVSAKWGQAGNAVLAADDPEYWGIGAQLGYGAFSVGGSYSQSSGSAFGITDGEAYDIGARYQSGRYGISIHYLSGQNTDDENAGIGAQEHLEALTLSASYALRGSLDSSVAPPKPGAGPGEGFTGPGEAGASVFGFVSMTDFSEDVGDAGLGSPGDDTSGFVVGTGFRLTF